MNDRLKRKAGKKEITCFVRQKQAIRFRNVLMSAVLCAAVLSAYGLGQISQSGVYAATAHDNVSKFKAVGDSFEVSCDTTGQTTATARIDKITHDVKLSGLYTVEIWTPIGEGAYNNGKYSSADIKIVKGAKFITAGSYADGVGIMGVIQLTGGNGANGANGRYSSIKPGNGKQGFFGGNGGRGGGAFTNGNGNGFDGASGGSGFYGGSGTSGANSGDSYLSDNVSNGGNGGAGVYPGSAGSGGYCAYNGRRGLSGAAGITLPPVYGYMINQNSSGSYAYYKSTRFPAINVQSYNGTNARIKITLKELLPNMKLEESVIQDLPEDGLVSYELSQIKLELESLQKLLEKSGDGIPDITVVKGKAFDKMIAAYDGMNDGSTSGVTVKNEDQSDGVIRVSGSLDQTGDQRIVIGGNTFIFHVVEEPDSANVQVVFD